MNATATNELRYYCQQLLDAESLDAGIPGASPRSEEQARVKEFLREFPAEEVKAMLSELRK
jgi:hypothetical protein